MSSRRSVTLSPRLLLLPILLLAALLRFWRLDTLPPGLYHDEAYNGLDALSLVEGKQFPQFYEGWELYAQDAQAERPLPSTRWPIFFAGNYGREPLHIYLMALSIKLFGATPFALRLVPALAGVLGVWTTYLAAAAIFAGRTTRPRLPTSDSYLPLVAALALAIFVPTIHFSRFGLRVMLFIPISTLTIAFFWRGIAAATSRRVYISFLAAGFFLGLGIYSYAA
ncbi:MAG: hypothetical protein KC443_01150, partial [Anaerolineales bacterium]|nr:hypothetical protein [Anaerolineales bacterium]